MNKFTSNDKETVLKSLGHLFVITKLSDNSDTYEKFINDKVKLDALIFHLTQVGELCTKFTDEFRKNNDNINFRGIIGLRNVMVHGYGTLHYEDIYAIIKNDVPKLVKIYNDILINNYGYNKIDSFVENYYNTRKFEIDEDI